MLLRNSPTVFCLHIFSLWPWFGRQVFSDAWGWGIRKLPVVTELWRSRSLSEIDVDPRRRRVAGLHYDQRLDRSPRSLHESRRLRLFPTPGDAHASGEPSTVRKGPHFLPVVLLPCQGEKRYLRVYFADNFCCLHASYVRINGPFFFALLSRVVLMEISASSTTCSTLRNKSRLRRSWAEPWRRCPRSWKTFVRDTRSEEYFVTRRFSYFVCSVVFGARAFLLPFLSFHAFVVCCEQLIGFCINWMWKRDEGGPLLLDGRWPRNQVK